MIVIDILLYPVKIDVIPVTEGGIAPYIGSKDSSGACSVTSAIYRIITDEGIEGWGEMNLIFSLKMTEMILDEIIKPVLIGSSVYDLNVVKMSLISLYNPDINILHFFSGIEIALWDIIGKKLNQPLYNLLGGKIRHEIPIAYALGILDIDITKYKMDQIISEGFKTLKTKGGCDLNYDIKRINNMLIHADGKLDIRIDMNQSYNLIQALTFVNSIENYGIEYVEQPLPVNQFKEYQVLRSRSNVPVAVNEDCYIPGNLFEMIRHNAIDAGVVDLESIGGVSELIKVCHLAEAASLPLAHHCAWDLGIKTSAIIHCASSLPALNLAIDSTYPSHVDDILSVPLKINNGRYLVPNAPGLGIEVDIEKLNSLVVKDYTSRYVF